MVAALETWRTSWTAALGAVRLEPGADVAAVTTVQIREVVERLVVVGQWRPDDPEAMVVLDAGYDAPRIAHLLDDLSVEPLGRLRSDRVMRRPTPFRKEFSLANPKGGRGFRNPCTKGGPPAGVPKPSRPGPGRPPGVGASCALVVRLPRGGGKRVRYIVTQIKAVEAPLDLIA
ncbi:transposase [Streptomyces longispororuber]|uniref:transposase n=1 Tax=Streptomyces longispororuber TaxID=68230 RepID=UPI003570C564